MFRKKKEQDPEKEIKPDEATLRGRMAFEFQNPSQPKARSIYSNAENKFMLALKKQNREGRSVISACKFTVALMA